MRLTRVYCPDLPKEGLFDLPKDEVQHIGRVLRLKVGSPLIAFDGRGRAVRCQVASLDRRRGQASILEELNEPETVLSNLTIAVAPAKGKRMAFLIEKLTELGVGRIQALETEFGQMSRAQIDKERESWLRKSIEASKQCGRFLLPDIPEPKTPAQLCEALEGRAFIGSPKKSDTGIWATLSSLEAKDGPFTVFIGPEGGFSEAEIALLRGRMVEDLCLGDLILRIETAAIALAGLFRARLD